jgi:mitotic spindle assembly checkpoint protein MAD1
MHLDSKGEGGPQAEEMEQLLRFWIQEEQCIPGFLASVTVECYDKAKREGTLPVGPITV